MSETQVYTPEQTMKLLGDMKRGVYYKLTRLGLLKFSKRYPGGPRVHTQAQVDEYIAYLNANAIVAQPRRLSAVPRTA